MSERRYGKWAGNPRGTPEDEKRCIKEVWPQGGYITHQCRFKRGHGTDGLFCKWHAPLEEPK